MTKGDIYKTVYYWLLIFILYKFQRSDEALASILLDNGQQ